MRSIEASLSDLEKRGVRPVAISVDTPAESAQLCQKAGYAFTFLSDPKAEAIRSYDLLHTGAGANGQDIARPGEFLVDAGGIVRWDNLTGDIKVRATADEILAAAQTLP